MTLASTPGQTVGPFFGFALPYSGGDELVGAGTSGRIRLHGTIRDGQGEPVPDALVEIWQADATGRVPRSAGSLRRDGFTFTGWGRAETDRCGHYSFATVAPADARGMPFISVCVFARGLLDRLFTRAYLPDVEQNGAVDGAVSNTFLDGLDEASRQTLIAIPEPDGFRFDITLQGPHETTFIRFS